MRSKEVDSYLVLHDSEGKEVARDDDSGGFPNARIVYQPIKDGEFSITATTFDGRVGKYQLSVGKFKKVELPISGEITIKDKKGHVSGKMLETHPSIGKGLTSPAMRYEIRHLPGNALCQIDLKSPTFRGRLRVTDKKDNVITEASPYMNGQTRLVFRTSDAGVYNVIVIGYEGKEGEFDLQVQHQ